GTTVPWATPYSRFQNGSCTSTRLPKCHTSLWHLCCSRIHPWFFGKDLVAADVFEASCQITFGFLTAEKADATATSGLPIADNTTLSLTHQADYQPTLRQLMVSNVDCTLPLAVL